MIFRNNIIFVSRKNEGYNMFNARNYETDKGNRRDFNSIRLSENLYILGNMPNVWVNFMNNKSENVKTLDDWKHFEILANEKNNQSKGSKLILESQSNNVFKEAKSNITEKNQFYKSDFHLNQEYLTLYSSLISSAKYSDKKGMIISRDYYGEKFR